MQTKKIILILLVLVGLLLVGSGFVRDITPVAAAPAVQTDEDQADEGQTDDTQSEEAQQVEAQTLLDVIQTSSQLNDFETLIKAAGLADNLEKDGPFTVFAPTDAAMASFEMLAANSEATVTEILLYHIINGQYHSPDLANHSTLPTLLGEQVAITGRGGEIILNDMDNPVTIATTDQ